MAGRGPQTFKKKQKEQARKEKRQEKIARKLERKRQGQNDTLLVSEETVEESVPASRTAASRERCYTGRYAQGSIVFAALRNGYRLLAALAALTAAAVPTAESSFSFGTRFIDV